ncbi:hypothetical protein [Acrocarpospora corrugata]|nr:hypothetical protein [Acrocarpospora corrugata]
MTVVPPAGNGMSVCGVIVFIARWKSQLIQLGVRIAGTVSGFGAFEW